MHLDRLDRAALVFISVALASIAISLLGGDRVGVQIIHIFPALDSTGVATRAQPAITFNETMNPATLEGRLQITPALSFTLRWNGNTAFITLQEALQRDTTYTITVRAGGMSQRGRAQLRDVSWTFRTGHPRVIYVSPANEAGNLIIQDTHDGATPVTLTDERFGVFDFAASPDGSRIAYSATRDESGARDLWLINADGSDREQIVSCDTQVCQTPTWSADGARVAFERRNLVKGPLGHSPGPARIWVYDLSAKTSAPLSSDSQQLGTLPHWAPTGNRLSYYDPLASAITVLDIATGDRTQLPSVMGDPGAWSPDGQQVIFPELEAVEDRQYNQLLRADLASHTITPVMPLSTTNDASVAWSPAGSWIAFGRQQTGRKGAPGGYMPFGPQVWVSRPDGNGAHALTWDTEYSYGGLVWSPDGEWIAAVRNNLRMPNPRPEVWLIRADGSARFRLAGDATTPAWLP